MDNAARRVENSSFDERLEICKFLRDEVFMLTLVAVLSRGRVYGSKPTEEDAEMFKSCLRKHLEGMEADYRQCVDDEVHIGNIELLAKRVSASCGKLLCNNRFRIGSAQKALNLFLKYLWCLGKVARPPHCPFDRRIIVDQLKDVRCNWTECDDIECYRRWVAEAKEKAGTRSIAEWELVTYNNTRQGTPHPTRDG